MKIYTKTGDSGETGLFGGPRVRKDSPRIEAYGTVDELNAVVGWARTESLPPDIDSLLAGIQSELFDLGAELATPDPRRHGTAGIGPRCSERLLPLLESVPPGSCSRGGFAHGRWSIQS